MNRITSFTKRIYKELAANLDAACNWLEIGKGRAAQYSKLIKEFYEDDARSPLHILAYAESCEISDLFELWEYRINAFPGLDQKLKAVFLKGPLLREEENPATSNNQARNDAFVYMVAGRLLSASVPVLSVNGIGNRSSNCKSEADVVFEWNGMCRHRMQTPPNPWVVGEASKRSASPN